MMVDFVVKDGSQYVCKSVVKDYDLSNLTVKEFERLLLSHYMEMGVSWYDIDISVETPTRLLCVKPAYDTSTDDVAASLRTSFQVANVIMGVYFTQEVSSDYSCFLKAA